jgi:putative NADH-flavin reductase
MICAVVAGMQVAILGATGMIGQRLLEEALRRGHEVTAIARDLARVHAREGLRLRRADFRDPEELEEAIADHEALISAIGPKAGEPASIVVDATRAIAAACMRAGVPRVIVVGGAGSLNVKPGLELMNTEGFPSAWRDIALAHHTALELWRKVKELEWTVVSPAALIEPGERTEQYRTGHNDLLVDAAGQSRISAEDFALAVIDELERAGHSHERITFAY